MPIQLSISNAIKGDAPLGGVTPPFNQYSFEFDGNTDFIDCGSFSAYDNGDLSVSMWIKKSTMGTSEYAIDNSGSSTRAGFSIIFENAFRRVRVVRRTLTSDTVTAFTDIGFTLNTWHNIAFTYQDSTRTLKVYNDGVLKITTIGTASTNSASFNLTIGSYQGTSNYLIGNIDEVAIFNSELSSTDITSIYNGGLPNDLTSLSPLSWYRMGDAATWNGKDWILTEQGSGGNDGISDTLPAPPAQPSTDIPT